MRTLNVTTNLIPRLTATSFGVGRHLDAEGRRAFLGPPASGAAAAHSTT